MAAWVRNRDRSGCWLALLVAPVCSGSRQPPAVARLRARSQQPRYGAVSRTVPRPPAAGREVRNHGPKLTFPCDLVSVVREREAIPHLIEAESRVVADSNPGMHGGRAACHSVLIKVWQKSDVADRAIEKFITVRSASDVKFT